jgi:hypothetical protein
VTRYAILRSGQVENIIRWDGQTPWSPPACTIAIVLQEDSPVSAGWTYDGTTFTPPSTEEGAE